MKKYKYPKMHKLMASSSRAMCGINERELVIPKGDRVKMIKHLKEMGVVIIGTSYEKKGSKSLKVWYLQ